MVCEIGRSKGAKVVALVIMALAVSACATRQDKLKAPLTEPNETYIQVTQRHKTWCYTRVIEGAPRDEICQQGDFIRYSPEPHPLNVYRPIPSYVLALFGTMSEIEAAEIKTAYSTEQTPMTTPF